MSGPGQAATVTPGQAAYLATVTQAVIDGHGISEYPAYEHLQPWLRERWEAGAQAAIETVPGSERVAELVTEVNDLRRELAGVRKLAADLERDRNVLLAEQMRRVAIGAQDAP